MDRLFDSRGREARSATTDGAWVDRADPRESMMRLPRWMQPILTEITGKAARAERQVLRWSQGGRVALNLTTLAIGLMLSLAALRLGGAGWLLLAPGWLLTVAAMRTFQTSWVHHASHGELLGSGWTGRLLADAAGTSIWIQPLDGYREDHVIHHGKPATSEDSDLQFLLALGFVPGMTTAQYWAMLRRMFVSPSFHATYAWFRLRANFITARRGRRLAAIAWTAMVGAMAAMGFGWEVLVMWLIPAWPLYQAAGLMQILSEHTWVRQGDGRDRPRKIIARLTHARYFGEAVPAPGAGSLAWMAWTARMVLVHLPSRLFVAPGDLPNHDFHHRLPKGDWANSAYGRRDDGLANAETGRWPEYTERWGFAAAVGETFGLLASLPADAVLGDPLTYRERAEEMLGM